MPSEYIEGQTYLGSTLTAGCCDVGGAVGRLSLQCCTLEEYAPIGAWRDVPGLLCLIWASSHWKHDYSFLVFFFKRPTSHVNVPGLFSSRCCLSRGGVVLYHMYIALGWWWYAALTKHGLSIFFQPSWSGFTWYAVHIVFFVRFDVFCVVVCEAGGWVADMDRCVRPMMILSRCS